MASCTHKECVDHGLSFLFCFKNNNTERLASIKEEFKDILICVISILWCSVALLESYTIWPLVRFFIFGCITHLWLPVKNECKNGRTCKILVAPKVEGFSTEGHCLGQLLPMKCNHSWRYKLTKKNLWPGKRKKLIICNFDRKQFTNFR